MKKLFNVRLFWKFTPAIVLVILLTSQIVLAVGTPPRGVFLDFSGDMRTDFVLLRPSNGPGSAWSWNILRNQDSQPDVITSFIFGGPNDQITPANYYNANKAEVSFYRSSQATFFEGTFTDYMTSVQYPTLTGWGQAGDNARFFGDYDGDKFEDRTLFRYQASTGLFYWYIKGSKGVNYTYLFGSNNPDTYEFAFRGADYNGDGRDEIVLCFVNISSGQAVWYFGDPINQTLVGTHAFGNFNYDYLINPADYTGDRKADLVKAASKSMSPAQWTVIDPRTGAGFAYTFNPTVSTGDIPISGDYDGDGIYDAAWYRPSPSTFIYVPSTTRSTIFSFGNISIYRPFGSVGDTPVAGMWVY